MEAQTRNERLRAVLTKTAPELARALGGPLAGAAIEAASRILIGNPSAGEDELERAALEADPETLTKLRLASLDFQRAVLAAAETESRLAVSDRADARAREVALKDRIPGFLAVVILTGFFGVLGIMMVRQVPPGAETEFSIMLGSLATMAAAVMNYYFGSSAGSREKNWLLTRSDLSGRSERG